MSGFPGGKSRNIALHLEDLVGFGIHGIEITVVVVKTNVCKKISRNRMSLFLIAVCTRIGTQWSYHIRRKCGFICFINAYIRLKIIYCTVNVFMVIFICNFSILTFRTKFPSILLIAAPSSLTSAFSSLASHEKQLLLSTLFFDVKHSHRGGNVGNKSVSLHDVVEWRSVLI